MRKPPRRLFQQREDEPCDTGEISDDCKYQQGFFFSGHAHLLFKISERSALMEKQYHIYRKMSTTLIKQSKKKLTIKAGYARLPIHPERLLRERMAEEDLFFRARAFRGNGRRRHKRVQHIAGNPAAFAASFRRAISSGVPETDVVTNSFRRPVFLRPAPGIPGLPFFRPEPLRAPPQLFVFSSAIVIRPRSVRQLRQAR